MRMSRGPLETTEICFWSTKMEIFYLEKHFPPAGRNRENVTLPPLKNICLTPLMIDHFYFLYSTMFLYFSLYLQKKKKVAVIAKREPGESLFLYGDDDANSDSSDVASDSEPEELDFKNISEENSDASPSRSSSRSPSRSPKGRNKKRRGSPGSAGSSPRRKDKRSTLELLRHLTNVASTLESEPEEEDDDLVVTSDDEEQEGAKTKKVDKKERKQRTILDVDQLRKLSATALVLKFSRHTTSKVPKDLKTFTYQHQYACTMLPGICSEKFCGNALDTKPQIKRHLLRHIGELLTMTNQGWCG